MKASTLSHVQTLMDSLTLSCLLASVGDRHLIESTPATQAELTALRASPGSHLPPVKCAGDSLFLLLSALTAASLNKGLVPGIKQQLLKAGHLIPVIP